MIQNKVFNGFIASLLHDIGKLILDSNGSWSPQPPGKPHEEMNVKNNPLLQDSNIDFQQKLGSEIYNLSREHGKLPAEITANSIDIALSLLDKQIEDASISTEVLTLVLVDRLQKGMHGISEKTGQGIPQQYPHFFPYYGEDKRWDENSSKDAVIKINEKLSSPLSLESALNVQETFQKFPHTTYIPHISLSLHHRFSAVLYYFLYKKMKGCEVSAIADLCFSVIHITPDTPNLLYRMKDVRIIKQAMKRLREYLIEKVFYNHKSDLPEITKDTNPFEFFSGDSIVLIYDNDDILMEKLKCFINQDMEIHTLHIRQFKYLLKIKEAWKLNNGNLSFFSKPDDLSVREFQTTLLSTFLNQYPAIAMHSCSKCNKPLEKTSMDSKGDILCPSCLTGRKDLSKGINIEDVAINGDQAEKIGFISITIPEDLRSVAVKVAKEDLIARFKNAKVIKEKNIPTTATGLFEYLQAVLDIWCFQRCLNQEIETIQHIYEETAHTIYQSPSCVLFLLREDCYWSFLWFILEEKKRLHLPSSIKGAICDSHYPFWSLIDKLMSYTKEDIYYDATERRMVMFTDGEVNAIRDLANMVRQERITGQLQILVQAALRSSMEELVMEIDGREKEHKLGRSNFASRLKENIRKLQPTGADYSDREKRSIFIKYITKLAK